MMKNTKKNSYVNEAVSIFKSTQTAKDESKLRNLRHSPY